MKTIIFVKLNPQIRIYKQALGLKKTGRYKLVLIAHKYDRELFSNIFDKTICYKFINLPFKKLDALLRRLLNKVVPEIDEWNLSRIIKGLNPYIFHTHAEPNVVPAITIKNARCPTVFDAYDYTSLRSGFQNVDPKERKAEKICFENADGIVHKGANQEIDFYRQADYNITSKQLHFQDYCMEKFIVTSLLPKLSQKDGNIHIVHAGSIFPMSYPVARYGYSQYLDIARIIIKQKIHFHIYPNPHQGRDFPEYEKLAQENFYFHIHRPLVYEKLLQEISQYDYGCLIQNFKESVAIQNIWSKTTIGNRLFGYLEAGLPILVSNHYEYVSQIVKEHQIGLVINIDHLDQLRKKIEGINYSLLFNKVKVAQQKLSMKENIKRLEQFYKNLYANKNSL